MADNPDKRENNRMTKSPDEPVDIKENRRIKEPDYPDDREAIRREIARRRGRPTASDKESGQVKYSKKAL